MNKNRFFSVLSIGLFFFFGLLLPSQLGKHFWPSFAFVNGVRTDYLAPTIYFTDILLVILVLLRVIKLRVNGLGGTKAVACFPAVVLASRRSGLVMAGCLLYFFLAPIKLLFLYRLWQYFKILGAIFIFYTSVKNERKWFVYGLLGSSVYTLFLVVAQILYQSSLQGLWWMLGERLFTITTPGISTISIAGRELLRGYGTFSHPNSLAGFFLVVYILGTLYNLTLFTIPAILLILLSFSKMGIGMFVVFFLIFESQKLKGCRLCRLAKVVFALWVLSLLLFFQGSSGTVYERLASWLYAGIAIVQHPLGLTPGNYLYQGQPIHNIFLLISVEIGLIGLISLIGLIMRLIGPMRLIRLIHFREILLLLAILSTGMVDHYWLTLQQNMLLFGVVVGMAIARLRSVETVR